MSRRESESIFLLQFRNNNPYTNNKNALVRLYKNP